MSFAHECFKTSKLCEGQASGRGKFNFRGKSKALALNRWRKWHWAQLPLLAAGFLGLASCGRLPQPPSPQTNRADRGTSAEQAVAVDTTIATLSSLDNDLVYTGTTQPDQQVSLRARLDGEVTLITVDVGDPVTQGQAIARLDANLFSMAVNQAEAELQARRSEVAQAQAAVSDAQTALETARVQLQQARADAQRLVRLAAEGAVALQQAEQAQVAAETAAQVMQSAAEQIRTRQATVAAAQGRVTAQQAVVEETQEQLSFAVVQSPLTGVVLSRAVDVGDYAESGDELLQVGDLSRLKVMVEVSDLEISRVALGQPVTVRLDAFPTQELTAEITRIAPAADVTSRLIPVEVGIANDAGQLSSGLLARVTVKSQAQETVVIPNSALEMADSAASPTVFVVQSRAIADGTDGTTEPGNAEATVQARLVTVGRQTDQESEILSGLAPGEAFVVRSSESLETGQAVRLSVLSEPLPSPSTSAQP